MLDDFCFTEEMYKRPPDGCSPVYWRLLTDLEPRVRCEVKRNPIRVESINIAPISFQ